MMLVENYSSFSNFDVSGKKEKKRGKLVRSNTTDIQSKFFQLVKVIKEKSFSSNRLLQTLTLGK